MPLFLVPVLWATSAGAAAAGSFMGYRARTVWADAAAIRAAADEDLGRAQAEASSQTERTNGVLAQLDPLRRRVADVELDRGLRVFAAVRGVKRGTAQAAAGEVHSLDVPVEGPEGALTILDVAKGGGLALAGGAASAFGAFGLAGAVGTASTGTAIAGLSGAAATNASLAWLGGGALSAGGAGMTGGMFALGSAFAGPAIATAGYAAWTVAEKDRTAAVGYSETVASAIAGILANADDLRLVELRGMEVTATTAATAAAAERLTERMAEHLSSHGWREGDDGCIPFESLSPGERDDLALLGMALKSLHAILSINVVAEAEKTCRDGEEAEAGAGATKKPEEEKE